MHGHVVPLGEFLGWCKFCLTMLIEESTGTEVKTALISYDVKPHLVPTLISVCVT